MTNQLRFEAVRPAVSSLQFNLDRLRRENEVSLSVLAAAREALDRDSEQCRDLLEALWDRLLDDHQQILRKSILDLFKVAGVDQNNEG